MIDDVELKLDRSRPIARQFGVDIATFSDAARYVAALPYARNSMPHDKMAVLKEWKGTCSTKHALLAALAQEQGLPHQLTLCFFEMAADTHPQIAPVLESYGLRSILEAHCVLISDRGLHDFTGLSVGRAPQYTGFLRLDPDNLMAKQPLHKAALTVWASQQGLRTPIDTLWEAREECISALQQTI